MAMATISRYNNIFTPNVEEKVDCRKFTIPTKKSVENGLFSYWIRSGWECFKNGFNHQKFSLTEMFFHLILRIGTYLWNQTCEISSSSSSWRLFIFSWKCLIPKAIPCQCEGKFPVVYLLASMINDWRQLSRCLRSFDTKWMVSSWFISILWMLFTSNATWHTKYFNKMSLQSEMCQSWEFTNIGRIKFIPILTHSHENIGNSQITKNLEKSFKLIPRFTAH